MKIYLTLWMILAVLAFRADSAEPQQLSYEGIELRGHFVQGGTVFGRAQSGYEVKFGGKTLRQTKNGDFVFGFIRATETTAKLSITTPDGTLRTVDLPVAAREFDIQRIDGLPPSKVTPPEAALKRIRQDSAAVREARATETDMTFFLSEFQWPAEGPITGVYGSQRILNGEPRNPHYGVDVGAPTGTPVVAPAGGVITLAVPDMYYSGGTIILDHGHGFSSTFLHLSEVSVAVGDKIEQGALIGRIGATGRATGPHLDWRINWFGARLDPELLVPPRRQLSD